jgi:hypothetical protein
MEEKNFEGISYVAPIKRQTLARKINDDFIEEMDDVKLKILESQGIETTGDVFYWGNHSGLYEIHFGNCCGAYFVPEYNGWVFKCEKRSPEETAVIMLLDTYYYKLKNK